MVTNFLKQLRCWMGLAQPSTLAPECSIQPHVLPRSEHILSRRDISKYALKVLYRLHEAGYQAYLVGGGVRDVLLGLHPKDFDVATNAHPEKVSELFTNSRLIGRRFRLVHVHFGRNIVEVATFRANPNSAELQDLTRARSGTEGMILRDNVYGSLEEDVFRRDFTINALYYNIADYSLIDFVEGIHDLQNKRVKVIGDPATRYREDPLRMLRAVRFAAKLNFTIDPDSEKAIFECRSLLLNVPAARLFDEYLKLFLNGYAAVSYHLLWHYKLLGVLFPRVVELLNNSKTPNLSMIKTLIDLALSNTDDRIRMEKTVSPHFLLAVLLWFPILIETEKEKESGATLFDAFHNAMETILNEQRKAFAIPRRLSQAIKEIWIMQNRLKKRHRHRAANLFAHPRFKAAYDFLLLRAEVKESIEAIELCDWWTKYLDADESTREVMAQAVKNEGRKRRGSRKNSLKTKKPKIQAS